MSQKHEHEPEPKVFSKEKPEDKEVFPPDPPEDPFPTEKAVVFGDASATYGSMVAPEVIRRASGLPLPGPQKKEFKKEEDPKTEELKEELEHRHEEEHEAFKRVEKHKKDHR